jgi:hypothetical protein
MFLDFSPRGGGGFMGTITTLHVVAFSFFSKGFRRFYTSICYVHLQIFFPLDFLKIIFILYNIEVLKRECYKTYVHVTLDESQEPSHHQLPTRSTHQAAVPPTAGTAGYRRIAPALNELSHRSATPLRKVVSYV